MSKMTVVTIVSNIPHGYLGTEAKMGCCVGKATIPRPGNACLFHRATRQIVPNAFHHQQSLPLYPRNARLQFGAEIK